MQTADHCDMGVQELRSDKLPLIQPDANEKPSEWIKEHQEEIKAMLHQHGGVLLRGFDIQSLSEFNRFSENVSNKHLLEYVNRSTPRTRLGGKIYTSTEYPADQEIPLHNENSYTHAWPSNIMFYCAIQPGSGGQTPIADSRKVLERLDPELVKTFEEKKIQYVRNCGSGLDLTWQTVFQTEDPKAVEAYCDENNIQYEWSSDKEMIRISQTCQATVIHPITGEKVWFNQAHLFNIQMQPKDVQDMLINELGEERLPRNSFFGDGTQIPLESLQAVAAAYEAEKILFDWEEGDIMMLDNILMAHGRMPYSGSRKIAVSMF